MIEVHIVRGRPTPAEAAALVAVLSQIAAEDASRLLPSAPTGSHWSEPAARMRGPHSATGWWTRGLAGG